MFFISIAISYFTRFDYLILLDECTKLLIYPGGDWLP